MEIKDKKTVQIRICSELISNGFPFRIFRSSISDFDKYKSYYMNHIYNMINI